MKQVYVKKRLKVVIKFRTAPNKIFFFVCFSQIKVQIMFSFTSSYYLLTLNLSVAIENKLFQLKLAYVNLQNGPINLKTPTI